MSYGLLESAFTDAQMNLFNYEVLGVGKRVSKALGMGIGLHIGTGMCRYTYRYRDGVVKMDLFEADDASQRKHEIKSEPCFDSSCAIAHVFKP